MITHEVEAMLVGNTQKIVVAIDKLDVAAGSHSDTHIAGAGKAAVGLAQIDNLVFYVIDIGDGGQLGAVVDDDDFALARLESQGEDGGDALAQHIGGQVVAGDDKGHQWRGRSSWCSRHKNLNPNNRLINNLGVCQ